MSNTGKNWFRAHLGISIFILVIPLLVALLFFALKGKTSTIGAHPSDTKTESIVCTKDKAVYIYAEREKSLPTPLERVIRIVGTFNDSEAIEKISLDYTVVFSDAETAERAGVLMQSNLGKSLAKDELSFTEFDNRLSYTEDGKITLSFYAPVDKISGQNAQYILLPARYATEKGYSITADELKEALVKNAFNCVSTY